MFFVNSEQELIKTLFFTKNCGFRSTFQDFIPSFRLNFEVFAPQIQYLRTLRAFLHLKNEKWAHFLAVKIYGGFWENMGPWVYFFASIWCFWVGQKGLKIAPNDQISDFGHFKGIFTSENLILNTFSGSINLWRLLGEYGPLGVLLCLYMGLLSGSEGLKIA